VRSRTCLDVVVNIRILTPATNRVTVLQPVAYLGLCLSVLQSHSDPLFIPFYSSPLYIYNFKNLTEIVLYIPETFLNFCQKKKLVLRATF